jgi:hypothetical protein
VRRQGESADDDELHPGVLERREKPLGVAAASRASARGDPAETPAQLDSLRDPLLGRQPFEVGTKLGGRAIPPHRLGLDDQALTHDSEQPGEGVDGRRRFAPLDAADLDLARAGAPRKRALIEPVASARLTEDVAGVS